MRHYLITMFMCVFMLGCWQEQDQVGRDTDPDDDDGGLPALDSSVDDTDVDTGTGAEPPDTDEPGG